MRDPERIGPMLGALEKLWQTAPDLRLGQLITILVDKDVAFYIEDDDLLKRIEEQKFSYVHPKDNP